MFWKVPLGLFAKLIIQIPFHAYNKFSKTKAFPFLESLGFVKIKILKFLSLLSKGGFDISGHGLLLHLFLFRELYQMGAEVAHI